MDRGKFIPRIVPPGPDFDGSDYVPVFDKERLTTQMVKIFEYAKDGHWHTLSEGAEATGAPEASYSAQLRNFRKARFGGHTVEKRWRGRREWGHWEYRLILKVPS